MDELDGLEDDLQFCRQCNLPMYQKDDPKKFMVFSCRSCGTEEPLDYFFTLENKRINGMPVLPKVKDQGNKGVCNPTALLTLLETETKTAKAELHEEFHQESSLDDLLMKYKEKVGISYEHDVKDSDYDDHRAKTLLEILLENGVALKDNPAGGERLKAREFHHLTNQSFTDLAGHILKGHPLKIKMPITKEFLKLMKKRGKGRSRKGGEMYIARAGTKDKHTINGSQGWHSVVLVGFGRKQGVEYFRYMNSHGTEFDDEGFGNLRASEINEAFLIMI